MDSRTRAAVLAAFSMPSARACFLNADARTGKNGRHRLGGLLRQSVFGRLAGYEDVNDAVRLSRDLTSTKYLA